MNALIAGKREQLRSKIRRDTLEQIFKQKRILCQVSPLSEYWEIHQGLCQNVEKQSEKLVKNRELMNELMSSPNKIATLILANSCASESSFVINALINDYQIHNYFMEKIKQDPEEWADQIFKSYTGLANLLFSNPKFADSIQQYLFQEGILSILYKYALASENSQIDSINTIFRTMIGLLSNVSNQVRPLISSKDLIGICQIAFSQMEFRLELSIHVIRLSTNFCNELLELLDEENFKLILFKIENSEGKEAYQYIRLIDDLFSTSETLLVVNYLENSNFDSVIKYTFTTQSNLIIQATLNLLYNRAINSDTTIQQFVYLFYDEIINTLKFNTNIRIISICILILTEMIENNILEKEAMDIFRILFDICQNTYICFDYSNCTSILKLIFIIQTQYQISLMSEYKKQLKQMTQSECEDLSDVVLQILAYQP